MGCDIHFYVEKRVNGTWVSADTWEKDAPYHENIYSDRNYSLFAILADVRNGHGFAGVKTGDGFVPICQPKGLPEDCSPEVKADSDNYGADGHSHSWHTVADIMAYDWTRVAKECGWVQGVAYEEWIRWKKREGESPREYCGDSWGAKVLKISSAEMDELVSVAVKTCDEKRLYGAAREQEIAKATEHCYTFCEWEQNYYKCAPKFLGETLPQLWRLGKPDDVRIVFWFDN